MNHGLLVNGDLKGELKIFHFLKRIFRIFEHDLAALFLLATWGHIYRNRLVLTPSSALTSQKSKKFEKMLLILNIAMSRFWVRTNVYYIQLDQTARFDSFLTSLTQV